MFLLPVAEGVGGKAATPGRKWAQMLWEGGCGAGFKGCSAGESSPSPSQRRGMSSGVAGQPQALGGLARAL